MRSSECGNQDNRQPKAQGDEKQPADKQPEGERYLAIHLDFPRWLEADAYLRMSAGLAVRQ